MKFRVNDWLSRFEAAVNERDFATCLELYAPDAVMFGTRADLSFSTDDYLPRQWERIWNESTGFTFSQEVFYRETPEIAVVGLLWENNTIIDGVLTNRQGRATFSFELQSHKILAIHSHFSENPA